MDTVAQQHYVIKMNDREYRLLLKGLALAAGLKVSVPPEERQLAVTLNKSLLDQRVQVLTEQLRVAAIARDKAHAAAELAGAEAPIPPDDPDDGGPGSGAPPGGHP